MAKAAKFLPLEFKLFQFLCKLDESFTKENCQNVLVNILVSGGRDSICLLHALSTIMYSRLFKSQAQFTLIVTHFNHKKRSQESDEDSLFVLQECLKLGIECFLFNIKNEMKINFQNFARCERQRLSTQLCETLSTNKRYNKFILFTAHHADDHVESILMHLIRGAGTKGLEGFYGEQMTHFLKPFAEIFSDEIKAYAEKKQLAFRTDSSNLTDDYDRNFLRHHILPKFKKINNKYDKNILRFSKKIKELNDEIEATQNNKKNFVFLPNTTLSEFYVYLKKNNMSKNSEIGISENILKNILHEVNLLRHAKTSTSKSISIKKDKKLTISKNPKDKNQILAFL